MSSFWISSADIQCRYLSACYGYGQSRFVQNLKDLGIRLPGDLSLRTWATRGWFRPRLRVPIPAECFLSWRNFPLCEMQGVEDCPAEHQWGLTVLCGDASSSDEPGRPIEKLWMHWLDDPEDKEATAARTHAIDPVQAPEPTPIVHLHRGIKILPFADFFAHWQAYHAAELVRSMVVTVEGVTDQFSSWDNWLRERARDFDKNAKALAVRWESWGSFFDIVDCYRTIMARCLRRDTFEEDVRAGAQSLAAQRGIGANEVKEGIRDVFLQLWDRWASAAPNDDPRLMHSLQYDIQCAVRLWSDLSGSRIDPFDPFWFSRSHRGGKSAKLIDALPHEEWQARRDFAQLAPQYQSDFPAAFAMGEEQFADLLAANWTACTPLRRFCLAWVRLHNQLRSPDKDRSADQTIAANERIEQFNLVGLHTERLLRHAHAKFSKPEPDIGAIVAAAVERSVRATAKRSLNAARRRFKEMRGQARLYDQPRAEDLTIESKNVATGSTVADQLVAAHLNALILRNYAAHHDYLDDDLIYPGPDRSKPHAGFTLLSSCLFVVVAALRSLGEASPSTQAQSR